ncbi:MAG: hypothetical protein ACOH2V_05385 [Candidatus Saccharimonadaceae bacterium]
MPVSINMLFVIIPYGGIISFIALYGRSIKIENSGMFFLLLAIGIAISRIFSGRSFDRVGPKSICILGLSLLDLGIGLGTLIVVYLIQVVSYSGAFFFCGLI